MSLADVDRHARTSTCDERRLDKECEYPRVMRLTQKPRKNPAMTDTTTQRTEMAATALAEYKLLLSERDVS